MPVPKSREMMGDLRTLLRSGVVGALTDAQLLDRFLAGQEGASGEAFEALVKRHGPMVLGVCRRVLGDEHEAEDAFQATFLVLARKAATIAHQATLANWLYGVALRTARDARTRRQRGRAREERMSAPEEVVPGNDESTDELHSILDEELARLPERVRLAVILCELECLPRQAAARRLGIPEGTLSSRLARGKALLRDRLVRRGVTLSAATMAMAVVREAQALSVPYRLAESTMLAATRVAAGSSIAGVVSASVSTLTEGVIKTMFLTKLKATVLGLFAVGAAAVGTAALYAQQDVARVENRAPRSAGVDRLGEVEQKLDRILERLGNQRVSDVRKSFTRPADLAAPRPSSASADASPELAVVEPPPAASSPRPSQNLGDRLAALEAKLTGIEERVGKLEHRLGVVTSSGEFPPDPVTKPVDTRKPAKRSGDLFDSGSGRRAVEPSSPAPGDR